MNLAACFKPFQGLFCISTREENWSEIYDMKVSNPSRDYSAFLLSFRVSLGG